MKIYTLGTGHGDSTESRFNSSTAYETTKGTVYLVDAGAPAEALLRRKGLKRSSVKSIFITHMHDDHAGGLTGLLKQIIKYPQGRRYPVEVYFPEENALNAFKMWFSALHENADDPNLVYKLTRDGVVYDDDELTVSAVRTCHLRTLGRTEGKPCSFAYVLYFKEEEKTVLHTGDLSSDFSDFPKISSERYFDVCLCEATHYRPEDADIHLQMSRFGKLIFIHIGDRWHNEYVSKSNGKCGEEGLLSYCADYPYEVFVAHDGDEFII